MFDTLSSLQHAANNLGINALDADRLLLSVLRRSASERTWLRVHGSEAVSANTTTDTLRCASVGWMAFPSHTSPANAVFTA